MVCKALLLPDCFAFDKGEEAILIFPNQFVANEIIALGEIPLMNVYNNFGTAILGDATTYPFAVQSITYGFLPAPQAMTVNRVIIAMATLLALYSFFRAFFGRFKATLVSTPISQVNSIFDALRWRLCYKNQYVEVLMEWLAWHTRWVNRNGTDFGSILTAA